MAVASNFTDNLNIDLNIRYIKGYQAGQVQTMVQTQFNTIQGILDSSSTEDFFVSGEFLKIKSNTNGVLKFDIAKVDLTDPQNPVYPKVVAFVELPAGDMINQIKNTTSGIVHKKYNKGELINVPLFERSMAQVWLISTDVLLIGDEVQLNNDGNGVKKYATGEGQLLGRVMSTKAVSGEAVKVLLY
jgi:hypothetical protein